MVVLLVFGVGEVCYGYIMVIEMGGGGVGVIDSFFGGGGVIVVVVEVVCEGGVIELVDVF